MPRLGTLLLLCKDMLTLQEEEPLMSMIQFGRAFVPLLLIATAACSGGEAEMQDNTAINSGPDAPPGPAELAADAELANEAAADEAADIEAFGGNAAAMEGNSR